MVKSLWGRSRRRRTPQVDAVADAIMRRTLLTLLVPTAVATRGAALGDAQRADRLSKQMDMVEMGADGGLPSRFCLGLRSARPSPASANSPVSRCRRRSCTIFKGTAQQASLED